MPETGAVICNSGPLIALAGVGQLDLLRLLFGTVQVPAAVLAEVTTAGAGRTGASEVATATWIKAVTVEPPPDLLLADELGDGEAEVITLAMRHGAGMVLLDERRGRRIAEIAYGLNVRGTAGILIMAKRQGHIAEVRPVLEAMRAQGYFISDRLIARACREVQE